MDFRASYDNRDIRREMRKRKKAGKLLNATTSFFNAWFSYICIFITALLFAIFYLHTFFYFLLALLICLPVISSNLTAYVFQKLKLSILFSPGACGRGGKCELKVNINNPTFLPVSCFEITVRSESLFYGGQSPVTHSLQLKAHDDNALCFPVSFDKYGVYSAEITGIKAFDYLHLFSMKRDVGLNTTLTVMPETEPKDTQLDVLETEGFDEFTDNDRRGSHSSNVTDIREYIPGDRLSRIHWKLTEKLDKLIVKENEATSSNEFTVLLELYQPSREECSKAYIESGGTDDSSYHTLDRALEEAWSVSLMLLEAGEQFNFTFYNMAGDFSYSRIACRDDLVDAFNRAYYTPCYDTKDLALSVYNAAGLNKGTLIHVG
ncbi:MAG: DUF58 domain-containing protein [Lachnospiraceae bacterium]|nr:DUF58 domain-containing protein [Lachnospiraceae bacterium]